MKSGPVIAYPHSVVIKKTSLYLAAIAALAAALFLGVPRGSGQTSQELLWRHRNLGKALFENPTTQSQAPAELKKALDLAPNSFRDRLNYGLALLRAGEIDQAIAELRKAQAQDPKSPYAWFNLGIAYKRQERTADALREFERMVQLAPDEPVSHYNLGILYSQTNRPAEALAQFETAAKLDPKLVAPLFRIYNYYRLGGDETKAAQALAAFQAAKQRQQAADETEDMDWCFYAELYDPIQALTGGRRRCDARHGEVRGSQARRAPRTRPAPECWCWMPMATAGPTCWCGRAAASSCSATEASRSPIPASRTCAA